MRLWFLLLNLGAAPSSEQILERWPDGGASKVRTWAATDGGRVLVKETYFFTTGVLWAEISFGRKRGYDVDGWLAEDTPLNAAGNADGVSRRFQRDGGLVRGPKSPSTPPASKPAAASCC